MSADSLLRGDRVRLAALTPADYPAIARWEESTAYRRLFDTSPAVPHTAAAIGKVLEELQASPNAFLFGIRPPEGDDLIGIADLSDIEWPHGTAWLAIGLGPAHWDQGYGQEALRLLLDFGFWELNLYRVQLTVFSYNPRAIRVYEKLGFQREGVFRQAVHRDGQRHDMLLYGLLRPEWEALRAGPPAP